MSGLVARKINLEREGEFKSNEVRGFMNIKYMMKMK
jgi:hypothetical protein